MLFRRLLGSVSALSIFSIFFLIVGCSDKKDEDPNPDSNAIVSIDPEVDGVDVARSKSISINSVPKWMLKQLMARLSS